MDDDWLVEPDVTVYQRSKTVWIVETELNGRHVEIKGSSRSLAIARWREAKQMVARVRSG